MLIQILLVAFSIFVLWRVFLRFRQKELSLGWFIFWIIFWLAVIVVVALPQTTEVVASWLGVGRGVDVAIYVSIVILFYLVFRMFIKIQKIEQNITELTRGKAIEEVKEPKDNERE